MLIKVYDIYTMFKYIIVEILFSGRQDFGRQSRFILYRAIKSYRYVCVMYNIYIITLDTTGTRYSAQLVAKALRGFLQNTAPLVF